MEQFITDIFSIYELMNKDDDSKGFIKIKTISKQYLAYYIYRIITKYMNLFQNSISKNEIIKFLSIIGIPPEHNILLNYPLAGKMTNDEKLLDLFIITGIDFFNKVDIYIKDLPNDKGNKDIVNYLKSKDLKTILQNLVDLQMLLPGISESNRPKYMNNNTI